jgi:hypothetical protein
MIAEIKVKIAGVLNRRCHSSAGVVRQAVRVIEIAEADGFVYLL